jgi:hypothetical protein
VKKGGLWLALFLLCAQGISIGKLIIVAHSWATKFFARLVAE